MAVVCIRVVVNSLELTTMRASMLTKASIQFWYPILEVEHGEVLDKLSTYPEDVLTDFGRVELGKEREFAMKIISVDDDELQASAYDIAQ